MPDAHPGSFAIGFPNELNVCFDPVRALVVYAWDGNFVDLTPTLTGKFPRNAEILGDIFHRADASAGFSFPKDSTAAELQFQGYRIREEMPEFRYEINGTEILLTVSAAPDGTALHLLYRIDSWPANLRYIPSASSPLPEILAGNAQQTSEGLTFPAGSLVEFREVLTSPR